MPLCDTYLQLHVADNLLFMNLLWFCQKLTDTNMEMQVEGSTYT